MWADGEPNNDGNEDCVILDNFTRNNNYGKWLDKDCTLAMRFLCNKPTDNPTAFPTINPSLTPTTNPTINPTTATATPSYSPSSHPSKSPTFLPTKYPSSHPTMSPSQTPTSLPSLKPSSHPTRSPSKSPSYADGSKGIVLGIATTKTTEPVDSANPAVPSTTNHLGMLLMSIALFILIVVIFVLFFLFKRRTKEIEEQMAIGIKTKATEQQEHQQQQQRPDISALPVPIEVNGAFTISNLSMHDHIYHPSAGSISNLINQIIQITPTPENMSNKRKETEESQEELYSDPGSMLHRQITPGSVEPIKVIALEQGKALQACHENTEPVLVTPEGMNHTGDNETRSVNSDSMV